jgi:hypothetical protein
MSAPIAEPEMKGKSVNIKADNASNCFMIIVLLRRVQAHKNAALL